MQLSIGESPEWVEQYRNWHKVQGSSLAIIKNWAHSPSPPFHHLHCTVCIFVFSTLKVKMHSPLLTTTNTVVQLKCNFRRCTYSLSGRERGVGYHPYRSNLVLSLAKRLETETRVNSWPGSLRCISMSYPPVMFGATCSSLYWTICTTHRGFFQCVHLRVTPGHNGLWVIGPSQFFFIQNKGWITLIDTDDIANCCPHYLKYVLVI